MRRLGMAIGAALLVVNLAGAQGNARASAADAKRAAAEQMAKDIQAMVKDAQGPGPAQGPPTTGQPPTPPFPFDPDLIRQAIDVGRTAVIGLTFVLIAFAVAGVLKRLIDRRHASVDPAFPQEMAARMERLEQGVDAIAVEIERIAEGQRFVTKLMANGGPEPVRIPAATADRPS